MEMLLIDIIRTDQDLYLSRKDLIAWFSDWALRCETKGSQLLIKAAIKELQRLQ